MGAVWEALRQELQHQVSIQTEIERFAQLRARDPALAQFLEPAEVAAFLSGVRTDRDARDAIAGALVVLGREEGATGRLARNLLWLGLWPDLDGLYRFLCERFSGNARWAVSELAAQFTERVRRLRPAPGARVVATLLLSTRREVFAVQRRERRYYEHHASSCGEDPAASDRAGPALDEPPWALWLAFLTPLDRDVVRRVVLEGESQQEVATALGLSHDAARKRFQRALRRLWDDLAAA